MTSASAPGRLEHDHKSYSAKVLEDSRACVHRWQLAPANGTSVVTGQCAVCGASKPFSVSHRHDLGPLWRQPGQAAQALARTRRLKGGSRLGTDM